MGEASATAAEEPAETPAETPLGPVAQPTAQGSDEDWGYVPMSEWGDQFEK